MRLRVISIFASVVFASLGAMSRAEAAPIVTLHASNLGIGTMGFAFNPVTNTITITEDWLSTAMGSVQITGLDANVNYTVVKEITNSTGTTWNRLANELLDPAGQPEDTTNDPQPYPAFVPAGFSTSSDFDGLSFAQGSGLPRTSTAFANVFADELTDARDFLDYFNGSVVAGSSFSLTFGLRDNSAANQPFLLVQRPNVESRPTTPVPEPATILLVGAGFAAAVRRRLKRKQ